MCEENHTPASSEHYHLAPKRLNPADTIFRFIQTVKEAIIGLGVGALAMIRQSPTYALLFIGAALLLLLVFSFFSWLRHTYWVENGELRVAQGVFIRKRSYISVNRIHTIDLTANVLHRILRLVRVSVVTASGESEMVLRALKRRDAEQLRQALHWDEEQANTDETSRETIEKNPQKKVRWGYLFLAGMTSGSAGFLLLGGWFLFGQIQQYLPDSLFENMLDYIIHLGLIFLTVLLVLGFIALWLLGTLGTVIKFGRFTIEKRDEELFVTRGLLETKEMTIPYDRIQAIEIQQNILRKPLKFSRVIAVTAGSSAHLDGTNPVIFPMIPDKEIKPFLAEFVPDYEQKQQSLIPLAKKGLKYYLTKHALLPVLLLLPIAYFLPAYSWIPGVLVILSLLFGWLKFSETGYRIDGQRITVRKWHMLTKSQTTFYRRRVQAYEKHQHKLQQIESLATADFSIISLGTQTVIRHLDDEDANRIGDWNSRVGE